jgi:hypothetical protein
MARRAASRSKEISPGRKYTRATTRSDADSASARILSTYDSDRDSLFTSCSSTGEVSTQMAQFVLNS